MPRFAFIISLDNAAYSSSIFFWLLLVLLWISWISHVWHSIYVSWFVISIYVNLSSDLYFKNLLWLFCYRFALHLIFTIVIFGFIGASSLNIYLIVNWKPLRELWSYFWAKDFMNLWNFWAKRVQRRISGKWWTERTMGKWLKAIYSPICDRQRKEFNQLFQNGNVFL